MLLICSSQILILFVVIFSIFFILLFISIFECKTYKITKYDIDNIINNGDIKIIFFSDFHNKDYKNKENQIINEITSLKPNIIILGGDIINFSKKMKLKNEVGVNNAERFIEKLCVKIKLNYNNITPLIFFTFGNHELRLKNCNNDVLQKKYNDFINFLTKNNVTVFEDGNIDINGDFSLSTLSLYEGYYNKVFFKEKNKKNIDRLVLDKYFSNLDKNKFNIVSFHKPDYSIDFIKYGFDLVLSGHYHGGLVKLPIFGVIFSPDFDIFPKYAYGLYKILNKFIIVSSGLGEHFLKIRINNKPEICLINIKSNGRN